MVPLTVSLAVSRIETVPSLKFATYTRVPSGSTATPSGKVPTGTVVIATPARGSNTVRLLAASFVT